MSAFRRRRNRLWPTAAALAIWIAAPWTPITLCTLAHAAVPEASAPVPDCHRSVPSPGEPAAPEPAGHGCCQDVAKSCCLEAAESDAAPSAAKKLDTPAVAVAAVGSSAAAPPPVGEARVLAWRLSAGPPPLPTTTVLRL